MSVVPLRSPAAQADAGRLAVLDSVRGVAATVVVVHHCFLTQPDFSDFFFSTWRTASHSVFEWLMFYSPLRLLWDGSEAVILFYVLSGLVLSLPWVQGRPPSYPAYVVKRVCRIYIPYCTAVAGAAVLNQWLQPYATAPDASEWLNAMTWSRPVTAVALADHAIMLGHHNTINGVIHTLIWEMRVSLLFPFMLVPIVRWRLGGALLVMILLAAVIGGLQWLYGGKGPALDLLSGDGLGRLGKASLEMQWTAYYALFFVMGSVVALHLRALREAVSPRSSLLLLLCGLFVLQAHWSRLHVPQDLLVGLGAAFIIASALPRGPVHSVLSHRWLSWLGRISYSLYLVHVPLILSAVILVRGQLPLLVILVPTAILSLPAGWAFHVLVAEPSARLGKAVAGRPWFSRSRRLAAIEAVAVP